jgi:hypothetical protein
MSASGPQQEKGKGYNTEKEANYAKPWQVNYALKAKYAVYSSLVFFLVANPETYKIFQKFLGRWIELASPGGCPTPLGFFFHTGLFFLILWALMLFPKDL